MKPQYPTGHNIRPRPYAHHPLTQRNPFGRHTPLAHPSTLTVKLKRKTKHSRGIHDSIWLQSKKHEHVDRRTRRHPSQQRTQTRQYTCTHTHTHTHTLQAHVCTSMSSHVTDSMTCAHAHTYIMHKTCESETFTSYHHAHAHTLLYVHTHVMSTHAHVKTPPKHT